MTAGRDPDDIISAWLHHEAPERAPERLLRATRDRVESTAQGRAWWPARTARQMNSPLRLTFAAAVVVAVAVVGSTMLPRNGLIATPGSLSPSPLVSPSPVPSPSVSAVPSATPSPTPTPMLWTEASLNEDWPGPVRNEPSERTVVLPNAEMIIDERPSVGYMDPSGDTGSADFPWVDIQEVAGKRGFGLASNRPPAVDPTEQWIAYGLVLDTDLDGVADWRYGIDNLPRSAGRHRAWITDLHTGRTASSSGSPMVMFETTIIQEVHFFDTFYPEGTSFFGDDVHFSFAGGDVAGGGTARPGAELNAAYYVWASVIKDGRVVATDYAPDVGWLEPVSAAQVTPSSELVSPAPTPQLEDDPDVPGRRLWTVDVVNKSSQRASLSVAEDDDSGAVGRLVGTATPNVVAPGANVRVTFSVPAAGVRGWSIFVKVGQQMGGLAWSEIPIAGEFRIAADGEPGWLSP